MIMLEEYLSAVFEWFREAHRQWMDDLGSLENDQLEDLRPLHWGEDAPLVDIVSKVGLSVRRVDHASRV